MTEANQIVMNNFIIEMTSIKPLTDILNKLKGSEYRDCDIKWLDKQLLSFTTLGCKTLGMEIIPPINEGYTTINDYVKTKYIGYFTTLLEYFKTFITQ